MTEPSKYCRIYMTPDESGLRLVLVTYVSIHQSHCFDYCITEDGRNRLRSFTTDGETPLQFAKRRGYRIRRIERGTGGRIASTTIAGAMEKFRYLKRKQIRHLERDLKMVNAAIDGIEGRAWSELPDDTIAGSKILPGTEDLVNEHYAFE